MLARVKKFFGLGQSSATDAKVAAEPAKVDSAASTEAPVAKKRPVKKASTTGTTATTAKKRAGRPKKTEA